MDDWHVILIAILAFALGFGLVYAWRSSWKFGKRDDPDDVSKIADEEHHPHLHYTGSFEH